LKAHVRFELRNLADDDPRLWQPEAYDVIFCRNVIMYFTPDACRRTVARLTRSLLPGGYLFLGHAETLRGLSQDFHLHHTHGTFYYQRKDHVKVSSNNLQPSTTLRVESPSLTMPDVARDDAWVAVIREATDRVHALTEARYDPKTSEQDQERSAKGAAWDLSGPLDLLREERFRDALELMRELPPESSADPDVLLLHAVLLAHRGQFSVAQEVCRQLLAIDDLSAGAHYVLALCHVGLGNEKEATHHNQFAAHLDPTFEMPHLRLGLMARRRGERKTAWQALDRALLLLTTQDASRLLLFGGGFSRDALVALCRTEMTSCGERRE
jgi:chemotaxis protein methyltransferase CheR